MTLALLFATALSASALNPQTTAATDRAQLQATLECAQSEACVQENSAPSVWESLQNALSLDFLSEAERNFITELQNRIALSSMPNGYPSYPAPELGGCTHTPLCWTRP
jgi:hypothetical protein